MILKKDQLSRYMRQMIIPEISSNGQENILASSTVIHSECVEAAAFALYYLAASGVGEASCCIDDTDGWDELSSKLSDLNGDIRFRLKTGKDKIAIVRASTRIVSGNPQYVRKALKNIMNSDTGEKFIPTIITLNYGWRGTIRTFQSKAELSEFLSELEKWPGFNSFDPISHGHKLSGYFSSLMAVQEHLKLVLSIGKPLVNALYYDLFKIEFETVSNIPGLFYRLDRLEPVENNAATLSDAKVLIAGCGGLGSPAAYSLTSIGIGSLGLVDNGRVELPDLNRQILHSSSRLGMAKVNSAEIFLKDINSLTQFSLHNVKLKKENIREIIKSYDMIIGCLDSLNDRYMLNDACLAEGKPLVEAGVMDISGLVTSIIPGKGHCYRCIFPEGSTYNAETEAGILGSIPGLLGILQAAEAVKLISGTGRPLKNKLLLLDAFDTDIYIINSARSLSCKACSGI
ncbi:MAG: HesA/MoeB/ThiF family protein [Pseudomonadota bacterium]